jgi:hypothetical protein
MCDILLEKEQVSLRFFGLSLPEITPPFPYRPSRLPLPTEVCASPEQAAHYHTVGL